MQQRLVYVMCWTVELVNLNEVNHQMPTRQQRQAELNLQATCQTPCADIYHLLYNANYFYHIC